MAAVSSDHGAQGRRVASNFEPAGASLKLHQIRCVVAAARRGSFRKAALALNLQQSSVSRSIQELEARLGAVLFQRGAGGAVLTPVGVRFLEDAELAMRHLGRAADTACQVAQDRQLLRLGIVPIPGSGPLPQVLNALLQGAKGVRLAIDEGSSADLVTAVQTGAMDVAIVLRGYGGGVEARPAWREALETMVLLMALPPTIVVIMMVLNPGFIQPLFTDPIGHALIVGGITLQTVGYFFIRRIIRIQV